MIGRPIRLAFLLALGLAASACGSSPAPVVGTAEAPACTAPEVVTTSGRLCGARVTGRGAGGAAREVHAYLGIRYAAARRWERPEPYRSTKAGRATLPGKACPQPATWMDTDKQAEDCLFLNVRTPAQRRGPPLPVMVFLHGGAFILGTASAPVNDGRNLAAYGDVVVVSLGYRLGALGFLAGGAGEDRLEGNYGFADQQLALEWVRDNIRAFGGDADAVTLFGASAGAMSVGAHLVAPRSGPLFRAAIMQSNPYGIRFKTPGEAAAVRRAFDVATGECPGGALECLRRVPVSRVVEAEQSAIVTVVPALSHPLDRLLAWAPVVDGSMIPVQPAAAEITRPVIAGTNADEGQLFVGGNHSIWNVEYDLILRYLFGGAAAQAIRAHPRYAGGPLQEEEALARVVGDYFFTCPTRRVLARARTAHVYGYEFAHVPSYPVWPAGFPQAAACDPSRRRVCHGFELPFVFGSPVTATSPTAQNRFAVKHAFTDAERRLSDLMLEAWTSHARHLDPSSRGGPRWPRFGERGSRLVLGDRIAETRDAHAACDTLWDPLHARLARD